MADQNLTTGHGVTADYSGYPGGQGIAISKIE